MRGALRGDGDRAQACAVHRLQHDAHHHRGAGLRRVVRGARRLHGAPRADACAPRQVRHAHDPRAGQRLLAPEGDLEVPEAWPAALRLGLPRRTQAQPARLLPGSGGLHVRGRPGAAREVLRDVRGGDDEVPHRQAHRVLERLERARQRQPPPTGARGAPPPHVRARVEDRPRAAARGGRVGGPLRHVADRPS